VTADDEAAFVGRLGECVRLLRLSQRLSQEQVADLAGMSRVVLSAVERGVHAPNILNLRRIAGALKAPLTLLVDEAEDPSPVPQVQARAAQLKSDGAASPPGPAVSAGSLRPVPASSAPPTEESASCR
jgi:transcriptional regulator with XRE-family HTH domain